MLLVPVADRGIWVRDNHTVADRNMPAQTEAFWDKQRDRKGSQKGGERNGDR